MSIEQLLGFTCKQLMFRFTVLPPVKGKIEIPAKKWRGNVTLQPRSEANTSVVKGNYTFYYKIILILICLKLSNLYIKCCISNAYKSQLYIQIMLYAVLFSM